MRKLSLGLFSVALAACGSDAQKTSDAAVVVIDSKPIDAPKVFLDAPAPTYDFSCFGGTAATTATATVAVSGTTDELTQNGLTPTDGAAVNFFKVGNATTLGTVTSAGGGLFTSAALTTNGTPLDIYIKASLAANRTTYLYPPNPVSKDITNVPVPLVSTQIFSFVQQFAQVTQNDVNNGAIIAILSDCAQTPIDGATVSVKQGSTEVGTQYDLGSLSAMAAGTIFVFNVPDGDTTLTAKYGSMTFPVRTVTAHKAVENVGTITATEVLPGPL